MQKKWTNKSVGLRILTAHLKIIHFLCGQEFLRNFLTFNLNTEYEIPIAKTSQKQRRTAFKIDIKSRDYFDQTVFLIWQKNGFIDELAILFLVLKCFVCFTLDALTKICEFNLNSDKIIAVYFSKPLEINGNEIFSLRLIDYEMKCICSSMSSNLRFLFRSSISLSEEYL